MKFIAKGTHKVILTLFVISCLWACTKENPVGDDTDNTDGSITPNTDFVYGNTARAIFVNRANFVWNNMSRTKYAHNADKVIDDINGVYKFDCSGFIGQIVLNKVLSDHYEDLEANMGRVINPNGTYMSLSRPLVASFYDYFEDVLEDNNVAENNYWKVFRVIDSLKKGDFIIARYADEWRQDNNNSNTGHMMLAWEIGTIENGEIELQVMDATSMPHTTTADTRTMNAYPVAELYNGEKSGIGFGRMKFLVNTTTRQFYGYRWSLNSKYCYNLVEGDNYSEMNASYNRLEGILFARPI